MTRPLVTMLAMALLSIGPAAAEEAPPWAGDWSDAEVRLSLEPAEGGFGGRLTVKGRDYAVRGTVGADGALAGKFKVDAAEFDLTAKLDGQVLVLTSGKTSYRLSRKAAKAGCDLSRIRVGQRYHFDMQNDMRMIWTVVEVAGARVRYEMQMIMGGNPLGDPQPAEWVWTAPAETTAPETEEQPGVRISREKVTVSGVEFDCLVSEANGAKAWVPTLGGDYNMTFPGIVKSQMADGMVVMELVLIEGAVVAEAPEKRPVKAAGPDLSSIKVGQRYRYAMQNDLGQVWTVKKIEKGVITYDVQVFLGKDRVGDPTTAEWRHVAPEKGAAPPMEPGARTRREKVTVGAATYDCLVTEAGGSTSWVSMSGEFPVFPGVIRVRMNDGSVVMELTGVE